MRETIGISPHEVDGTINLPETDGLPLPVVPDWDSLVEKANEVARVIDRHLDYESTYQGHDLDPQGLCPLQRVNLVSDLAAVV